MNNFAGMSNNTIEIIAYAEGLEEPIKKLNYEWLQKYFRIEESDAVALSDPKKEIIEKGGFIFYAKIDNEIVGTASLLRKDDDVFELGKMAVAQKAQGNKIGTLLLEHCLKIATQKKIKTIILYSNTKLAAAIHLYRKYGFSEIELENGLYERADIKMEKQLF